MRRRIVSMVFLLILLAACSNSSTTAAVSTPGSSSTSTPPASVSASASPTPSLPAGFACQNASGGATSAADWPETGPGVTAVRVGSHDGYDRFVLQFDGTVPSYRITRQSPTFQQEMGPVTLEGSKGLLVKVTPVDWLAYTGPQHLTPGGPFIREVQQVENFEGVQQWGLGIDGNPCIRITTLTNPDRLVVDVATT